MLRRRVTGIGLAIVVHLLAFLLAYLMSPPITVKKPEPEVKSYPLMNVFERLLAPKPTPHGSKAKIKPRAAPPPPQTEPQPSSIWNMIHVSREVFAASDISRIPSQQEEKAADAQGSDADQDRGTGEGPGGAPLYNAEWYKEPTQAEMAFYLPKGSPRTGWGMVICRTIANYHVEDCRELGESPQGSGLARSVREASWQFRVRPPRIGGRPIVGAWVRIRFDMTVGFKNEPHRNR